MTTSPEIVLNAAKMLAWDELEPRQREIYLGCARIELADRSSVADRGVQAVPGEPVAYPTLWPAARDVLSERRRQVSEEGWTQKHDDEHGDGSMAKAAACYALHTEPAGNVGDYLRFWPWASDWWKPKDHRRNLVRAAALILAEIERLDRDADRKSRHAAAAPWLE